MAKEVLIPKKWIWDGSCTYSSKYDLLSKYFIKQPATAGTEGQVLSLNSDLEPIWKDEGELPAPGTEGQVLALNSSLEPVWQDDKTTTTFQYTDAPSTGIVNGDILIPDGTGVTLVANSTYFLTSTTAPGKVNRLNAVSDITSAAHMTGLIGVAFSTDDADGILIRGMINIGTSAGTTPGEPIYFTGSGGFSSTAPSGTGEYVRVAGYYVGGEVIFFNPSQDFILLS